MKIIECNVWCVNPDADQKNQESGMPLHDTEDRWLPYAFDLSHIRSIKQTGSNYFIQEGQATTIAFKDGDFATVDISYGVLLKIWKE